MKPGILCLLLVSGCALLEYPGDPPKVWEFALTWTCRSSAGCERTEEVSRIDRASIQGFQGIHFTSTQDPSFAVDAEFESAPTLPPNCAWVYHLVLFGHELAPFKYCNAPGGFELELSIPNEDATTSSMWLVEGRDVNIF